MKIGIVGLNWPGQQHVKAIEALKGEATLSAVCDLDPAKRSEFEGKCAVYDNLDRFFDEADTDAIVLAVPHHLHESMAIRALDAGKHVLIEKPMARSAAECSRMIEAAERSGRLLMVAHNWRYTPWCVAAKAIVESGELGAVQAVRTEWLLNFRPSFPQGSWVYNGELSGGGAVVSLAIHNVDALRFIIGEVDEVYTDQLFTDEWSSKGAENWAMAQMRFANGAIGHLFTGYTPFYPPDNGMLHIYGERGTLFFGPYQGEPGLWIRSAARSEDPAASYERVDVEKHAPGMVQHPQTNQMRHFLDCLKNGTTPLSDGTDIIRTIALTEMIYESGRTGRPVRRADRAAAGLL